MRLGWSSPAPASSLERSPPRSGPNASRCRACCSTSLESELERATIGLVPQRPDVDEFNLPSKLMNLMSRGVPVLASVSPSSEIARIVRESGAGWVVDAADPDAFPNALQEILPDGEELERRGARGLEFARRNFAPNAVARRFEEVLYDVVPANGDRAGADGLSVAVITGSTGLIGSEAVTYFGDLGLDVVGHRQRHATGLLRRRGLDRVESGPAREGARRTATATTRWTSGTATGSRRSSVDLGSAIELVDPHRRPAVARLGGQRAVHRLRHQRGRHAEPARGHAGPRPRGGVHLHLDQQGLRRPAELAPAARAGDAVGDRPRSTPTRTASARTCRSTGACTASSAPRRSPPT